MLFFTAPPIDTLPPVKSGSAISHSAKYLAAKLRDKIAAAEKRKAAGLPENGAEGDNTLYIRSKKKSKHEHANPDAEAALQYKIKDTKLEALKVLTQQMRNSTDRIYQDLYGQHWEEGKRLEEEKLVTAQKAEKARQAEVEASLRSRLERQKIDLVASGVFKDDYDPRY